MTTARPDHRPAKAALLAPTAAAWLKCRTAEGRKFYGIPSASRSGQYHLANRQVCTCEDYRRRGRPCFHILAVRLHVERTERTRAAAVVVDLEAERRRRLATQYDAIYGDAA